VTTVPPAEPFDRPSVPPLLERLVDDIALMAPRAEAPATDAVVTRFLDARDGRHGELVGQLVCPMSRLPHLVRDLARRQLTRPVDVSLVVDTGLGAVPKALSTVFSRSSLLTPRTIETAAPVDVDAVWLERVAEFVPDDVVAVVEPLRPVATDEAGTAAWLDAVRRVAEHGCTPKLRCGGPRASDVPSVDEVERFVRVVVEAKGGFVALGLRPVAPADGPRGHGLLNLLVAVARVRSGGDVVGALTDTDAAALAREARALAPSQVKDLRAVLLRCGADPAPDPELTALGLLSTP
jgi:hypothetical protein